MKRVFALLTCSLALAGCGSFSLGSFDFFGGSKGSSSSSAGGLNVRVESDPPGADVRSASGGACRTPCMIAVAPNGVTNLSFSLSGYLPVSASVQAVTQHESWDNAESGNTGETTTVSPNPVFVELEKAPPPPPPPKKKPAPKRAPPAPPPAQ